MNEAQERGETKTGKNEKQGSEQWGQVHFLGGSTSKEKLVTYEEFVQRNSRISAALTSIAESTAAMAWVNIAHPRNPAFVELMRAQDSLIEAAEQLLSTYEQSSR